MQKFKYLLLSSIFLLVFSCVKDNTNRDFLELNEVIKVEGIEKVYNIKVGDYLKIEPKITTRFNSEADLEFVWYKCNIVSMASLDTMSFEKNLNVQINDVKPGVSHIVVFKVTNKKTGTYERFQTELNTSGIYSKGIVALVETDGVMDLAFVNDGEKNIHNNIYKLSNNGEILTNKAKKIFCLNTVVSSPSAMYKQVLVTTDDENGAIVLDPELFLKTGTIFDQFLFPPTGAATYDVSANTHGQGAEVFIVNGKLYDRTVNRQDDVQSKFNSEVLCGKAPRDYHLSPIMLNSMSIYGMPLVYDDMNGRFMKYPSENSVFTFYTNTAGAFSFFDPGNLPGMKLAGAGLISSNSTLWAIMKETNGTMRLLTFYDDLVSWVAKFNTTGNFVIPQAECPMLHRATEIISTAYNAVGTYPYDYNTRGVPGIAIYVVDNKVYAFNISTRTEFLLIDGTAENLTIDRALCHSIKTIDADLKENWSTRIGLCVKDNSLTGKKGGVVYYQINFVGGISASQIYKNTGFCDSVIHFDYKAD